MKFREAVHDATLLMMERDPSVFLTGVGIIDPRAVFGTLAGALEKYGPMRVVEGPISENALTGICIGAATQGMRPVMVHHRMDFVVLSLDQIINHAAKWKPMFGGKQSVPIVIRAIVGRGWGNGAQHTQTMHALFAHVPGLKVVVPANPRDAKGLLVAAIEDDDPVIYIEHRFLHEDDAEVPKEYFSTPIGKANVVREGKDATVVAIGPMVNEALKAAATLERAGTSVEVIDLRTLRPLDLPTVVASVTKTGRLVVADSDWGPVGVAGEVIAGVAEHAFGALLAPPRRVTWPDTAVPSSEKLEKMFYPGAKEIAEALESVCQSRGGERVENIVKPFSGPF